MSASLGDQGFVMMDALVAVAILGLVGSGALALASNLLVGQDRQLDRSVALLTSELLARQYAEFGPDPTATGSRFEDELFSYEFAAAGQPTDSSRLRPMVLIARERGQIGAEELRLDFLAAKGPS